MIDKLDMLHQKKMMYSKEKTTSTKLIDYNECLVTSPMSYTMFTNFTQLYRRNRLFNGEPYVIGTIRPFKVVLERDEA